ncbi:uncharacterized protein LOC128959463 [Oppia nitens]|uniref:uncharacterized protein LOC128959463 n=1 Tax=Oppia nitens TaxID=1686743 RepID=UPI0023DA404F|nr:uncharacterized protein LOC128959463 [Oppia nitens]
MSRSRSNSNSSSDGSSITFSEASDVPLTPGHSMDDIFNSTIGMPSTSVPETELTAETIPEPELATDIVPNPITEATQHDCQPSTSKSAVNDYDSWSESDTESSDKSDTHSNDKSDSKRKSNTECDSKCDSKCDSECDSKCETDSSSSNTDTDNSEYIMNEDVYDAMDVDLPEFADLPTEQQQVSEPFNPPNPVPEPQPRQSTSGNRNRRLQDYQSLEKPVEKTYNINAINTEIHPEYNFANQITHDCFSTFNDQISTYTIGLKQIFVGFHHGLIGAFKQFPFAPVTYQFHPRLRGEVTIIRSGIPRFYLLATTKDQIAQYDERNGKQIHQHTYNNKIFTVKGLLTENFHKFVVLNKTNDKIPFTQFDTLLINRAEKVFKGVKYAFGIKGIAENVQFNFKETTKDIIQLLIHLKADSQPMRLKIYEVRVSENGFIPTEKECIPFSTTTLGLQKLLITTQYSFVGTIKSTKKTDIEVYNNNTLSLYKKIRTIGHPIKEISWSGNSLIVITELMQIEIFDAIHLTRTHLISADKLVTKASIVFNPRPKPIKHQRLYMEPSIFYVQSNSMMCSRPLKDYKITENTKMIKYQSRYIIGYQANKNKITFDKYGAKIFCHHCKDSGFTYSHHPYDCNTCWTCGNLGHITKDCKTNTFKIRGQSCNNIGYYENSNSLCFKYIAIDVEKLSNHNDKLIPGYVAIVGFNEQRCKNNYDLLFAAKYRYHRKEIKRYLTQWSGLLPSYHGQRATPPHIVKDKLLKIINNKIIVGNDIVNDLKCLDIYKNINQDKVVDLNKIFIDSKGQPIALRHLSLTILNKKIQENKQNSIKGHDPVIDARCCAKIYLKYMRKEIKVGCDGTYQWIRQEADNRLKK